MHFPQKLCLQIPFFMQENDRKLLYTNKVKNYKHLFGYNILIRKSKCYSCDLPAVFQQYTIPQCLMFPLQLGAQPKGPKDVSIKAGPWPAGIYTDKT